MSLESHPLADVFPTISADELDALVADVRAYGLREPIVLFEGRVLDGRHRLAACERAGVAPRFRDFAGSEDDALAFVLSANAHRRHLTPAQLAFVGALIANLPRGSNQHVEGPQRCGPSTAEVAKQLGISARSIESARAVERGGMELAAAARKGVLSLEDAEDVAKQPESIQRRVLELIGEGWRPRRAIMQAKRDLARPGRLSEGAPDRFAVIYADPPWYFSNDGMVGHSSLEYPCLQTSEICALEIGGRSVADIRASDAAMLFMWTTNAHLPDALQVIAAWGFEYKTNAVWSKRQSNPGPTFRMRHELLLVAKHGQPEIVEHPDSVFGFVVPRRHSAKPPEVRGLIERMCPHGPRLELFARERAEGWHSFGNEVGK